MTEQIPISQLQVDLATAIQRMEQITKVGPSSPLGEHLVDRLLECDLPRLLGHLDHAGRTLLADAHTDGPLSVRLVAEDLRQQIAAELRAEGERERERLRQALGLAEGADPCMVSMALHNAITGWEMAAHFVEGEPKQGGLIIHNEPARQIGDDRG